MRTSALRTALLATAVLLGFVAIAAPASAEDAPKLAVAWNLGVQSDYVFRGVSQTDSKPSGFGGVDLTYDKLYAGAWTANVDFKPFGDAKTTQEIDVYAGVRPVVATVNFDLGVQYYGYVNEPTGPKPHYTEVYAKATKAFGPATWGASVFYSPEFGYKSGTAWYYEANLAYAIDKKWSASGAVGRQEIQKAGDYTTWNAGIGYALTDHLGLDVRYYDTDQHGFGSPYKARGVVALKATF